MPVDESYLKFEKVAYGTYEFPWGTKYRLFGAPVFDDANLVIRFWEYTLTASFIGEYDDLPIEESVDGYLESIMYGIRSELEKPGRRLRIKGLSFGNVSIGPEVSIGDIEEGVRYVPDVGMGPKPSLFTFELEYGPHMSTLIWECKFYTHTCIESSTVVLLPAFTSFTTEVDFDVRDGLIRRAAIFEAHLPNSRDSSGNFPLFSPDDYADLADRLPVPEGFQRRVSRKLSKDYLSIVIKILDEEIESNQPYPEFLYNLRAPFSATSRLLGDGSMLAPMGFCMWLCSLSFYCDVRKSADKRYAAKAFLALLEKKYAATKARSAYSTYYVDDKGVQRIRQNPGYPILLELGMDNDSYSLNFGGRATWIVPTTQSAYLEDTMLFEERSDVTWAAWLNSMAPAYRAIGIRGLVVSKTDLPIIDSCNAEDLPTVLGPVSPSTPIVKPTLRGVVKCPPNRILAYVPDFEVIEDPNVIVHHPTISPNTEVVKDGDSQEGVAQKTITLKSPTIQRVGQSEYRLRFTGHVTTTSAVPSIPAVVEYQGAKATRIGKPKIKKRPINGVGDCLIFVTTWSILYQLDKAPDSASSSKVDGPRFEEEEPVDESDEGGGEEPTS